MVDIVSLIPGIDVQVLSSIVLALFTAVLAVVTYLYYRETQNHTEEMKKTREAEFKPVLKVKIEHLYGLHYRLALRNVGKGAAHDVKAKWGFEGIDHEEEWEISLITPGQEHEFAFPFPEDKFKISMEEDIENALEEENASGDLYFSFEGRDSLGNEFSDIQELNVVDKIKGRNAGEYVQKDEQRKIRKAIESLEDALGDIADEIELSGFDQLINYKNNQNVIETLKKQENVTLQTLTNVTGIKQSRLAYVLRKLKDEGVVDYPEEIHPAHPDSLDTEIEYIGSED